MARYEEAKSFTGRKRIRKSFGKLDEAVDVPNLIEVQKASYDAFLQMNVRPENRIKHGLQAVLSELFPIKDSNETAILEFDYYELEKPKYDVEESLQRDVTFASALKVHLRLEVYEINEVTGAKSLLDIKQQEVFMGEIPLMTDKGTFVVNGTERVIVSQMHRSPGVFFAKEADKTVANKTDFTARVIPYRGSWLDLEFSPARREKETTVEGKKESKKEDFKNILYVRIDRRRKLPVTTLLMTLDSEFTANKRAQLESEGKEISQIDLQGMDKEEILSHFYTKLLIEKTKNGWTIPTNALIKEGVKPDKNVIDAKTGQVLAEVGASMTKRSVSKILKDSQLALITEDEVVGKYLAEDMINNKGLVLAEAGDEITEKLLATLLDNGYESFKILDIDYITTSPYIRNTLQIDRNRTREDAMVDIYRLMRPGEPPTFDMAEWTYKGLFFDNDRYDLGQVGRNKMNSRLGIDDKDVPDSVRVLRKDDIIKIIRTLCELKDGRGEVDDIDHLGNRRVRSVGELMENQYRIGLLRMEKSIKERMQTADLKKAVPTDLINAKPATATVREFFGSSQLSQFMDQTNPLSEITHKRRLSALGPGGLTRERAGFEVRDVHPTHYGRVCPIETPEGPNIGLINSLATFARVNQYGFIETPYRKVKDGIVDKQIHFMTAVQEGNKIIAQADVKLDDKGHIVEELVPCRVSGDYKMIRNNEVELIDVSPKQLVSVAAALIPFLEHDDANRALMGSNMQRQAVPLLRSEAPFVGTGMESKVAYDSGVVIIARRSGIVDQVDANRIVIRVTADVAAGESAVDIYNIHKYKRSNQNTCINQKPLVKVGDKVTKGDIIGDGPATDMGELALGQNVLVAFMPWNGYNFEDSILISERLVKDDIFTSIHIEEFEVMSRDTKLGPEEITRDLPNVGEEALRNLDEAGIVSIGAEVNAGDILVGKVTPKGESPITPEEKLLRAIFGDKATEMRDTSLRLPPGNQGIIVDVRVFSRRGIDKDERSLAIERTEIDKLQKDKDDERKILERSYRQRFLEIANGATVKKAPEKLGNLVNEKMVNEGTVANLRQVIVNDDKINKDLDALRDYYEKSVNSVEARFEDRVEKVRAGSDLPPGVMKLVKVYVAVKRKLQPGDKMAGRHGNKGVVSRIVPVEDMPYLEDGTAVDIVLNPLGVPSRMNVGQILETHLGWACHGLGRQVSAALEAYQANSKIDQLKSELVKVYNDKDIETQIATLSNDDVLVLAQNLSNGVPVATPVFDGAKEADINKMLAQAGLQSSGQVYLTDGRTGEIFDRPVTVGYIYMIKLHHLVDDKIHARSTGPYSLVTQQPLGGKAQFGGQRFGEMEVWALEAYGAAYTLQEMLTVKSDDVSGRTKVYETIVRGEDSFETGVPESFNVLVKEIRSLGLNLEMLHEHIV